MELEPCTVLKAGCLQFMHRTWTDNSEFRWVKTPTRRQHGREETDARPKASCIVRAGTKSKTVSLRVRNLSLACGHETDRDIPLSMSPLCSGLALTVKRSEWSIGMITESSKQLDLRGRNQRSLREVLRQKRTHRANAAFRPMTGRTTERRVHR